MSFLTGFLVGIIFTYFTLGFMLRWVLPRDLWEEIKRVIIKEFQGKE